MTDQEEKEFREREIKETRTRQNWEMHHRVKTDATKSIDNILFVVGTGAFVLSVTFIGYLNVPIAWGWIAILILAWILMLAAITASALSLWHTAEGSLRNQTLLNNFGMSNFTKPTMVEIAKDEKILYHDRQSKFMRALAIWFLIAGVLAILTFAAGALITKNSANIQQHQKGEFFRF